VTCQRCGVASTHPEPTDLELSRAYGAWYRPRSGRFAGIGDWLLARSRASLARRLDRIAPPGPVLDVGSGDGTLLAALRAVGRDAEGLERDDADVTEMGNQWSAVVFWHSLEHLRAPAAALAHAATLLAPGGVLAIAIPNAGSLQARVFGERWFALDLPRHLAHVPASALTRRLTELGLRVERVSHWRGGQVVFGWLHGLVGVLPGSPDLYDAIRRTEARRRPMSRSRRAVTLTAAAILWPVAVVTAGVEALAQRGGSVYLEARRV
jgi:SAM-dependent methyltransferase